MDYGLTIGAGVGAPAAAAGTTLAMTGAGTFWYAVGALGLVAVGVTLKRLVPKHEV